jgi:hypothetical protein
MILKRNSEMTAEKNRIKYPIKYINNNDYVRIGTKGKVYRAAISPSYNCCLMMAHLRPKHVEVISNAHS